MESPKILLLIALFLLISVFMQAEASPLPEVGSLRIQSDKETLTWNSLSGTGGYHVYRGLLAALRSGDYGDCLQGSLQKTSAEDSENPAPGTCFFYLVSGFDESGEGLLGSASSGAQRFPSNPCIPARRFFDLTTNGIAVDGIEDGSGPRRNSDTLAWSSSPAKEAAVLLCSGSVIHEATDLAIPGRGFDWEFRRSYQSQIRYSGPMGNGWDFLDNARLSPLGADILFFDGTGRREEFFREDATHFASPAGLYALLRENPDGSFTLRFPDGVLFDFHAFDGSNLEGALKSIEDPNGNRMTYQYDHQGLLTTMTDTLGRAVSFAWNSGGYLTSVTDFRGRSCLFSYDSGGDLISTRSPIVTGTPNGNDFPSGKTTSYTYSSGFSDERLNHNLLSVVYPNELGSALPVIQNSYGVSSGYFDFDRVISQTIGGTNGSGVPAGGTLTYSYEHMNESADPNDLTIERRKTVVVDRNGNSQENYYNYPGNLLRGVEFTNRELRPGEPDYTTEYAYNADGEITGVDLPDGNRILLSYDTPGTDRYREGNLLEMRLLADTVSSGGRGNGRGGEISDIVWSFTYEPVYNQMATETEPRGNDPGYVPQNGGTQSPERYRKSWIYDYQEGDPTANGINSYASDYEIDLSTASFNLGDLNGDGSTLQASGNLIKEVDPAVTLDPSSNQAAIEGDTQQDIVTLLRYDDLGQLIVAIDAEKNRHELSYHPEDDPDGDGSQTPTPPDGRILDSSTGGYLKTSISDTASDPERNNGTNPPPASIREDYEYDPAGNLTSLIDGRGIRTKWIYNELDQVVEMRRAISTADSTGWDGSPPTGRGETGLTNFGYKVRYEYDADDNIVRRELEDRDGGSGAGLYIETSGIFDLLDNLIQSSQEVSSSKTLISQYRYDANENLVRVVQPEGNSSEWAYDERDLLLSQTRGASGPRGGTSSTASLEYDGNGNLKKITDGRGNPVDFSYDGLDRLVRQIDQVGNTADLYYDPADNVIRQLHRGPVGGPTPPDRSGSTNVDLADLRNLYDEASRVFREDRSLFTPAGAVPSRPTMRSDGSLIPGDGFVNTVLEYDRLSRVTFRIKDSSAESRFDYNGLDWLIKETDPGANLLEYTYDADSNLIEAAETESSSSPGPPPELFLTTYFYDALDRRVMAVDNMGQTWRNEYDSLDRVVTQTDPNGPLSGTINRRSPGREGMTISINSHGNVVKYTYDAADRPIATIQILTTTGKGDGTTSPAPDTSNSYNPDGKIIMTTSWDDNSLVASQTDDRGNVTSFIYDNLDRLVQTTADDETTSQTTYDGNDNPVMILDPNGSNITYMYDGADRRTRTMVVRAAGIEGTTLQSFEYDGFDRLTKAADNSDPADVTDDSTVSLIYDSLGRVMEESQSLSDGTGNKYSDLGWLAGDLMTDLIYPSGRRIQYSYDSADRLITTIDTARPESASYKYFGLSRVHTRSYGNGIRTTLLDNAGATDIGYDGARQTILLRHLNSGNILSAGFEYGYDRGGNRKSVRRMHDCDGINFKGELYGFDSSDRLVNFKEVMLDADLTPSGPILDEQLWTLDGAGNWSEMTRRGETYRATPNNLNEYDEMQSGGTRVDDGIPDDFLDSTLTPIPDGWNLAHNKNGSQTKTNLFEIRYDFMDRPVRSIRLSDNATVAEYSYDALGRRIQRQVANSGDLNETVNYFYPPALEGIEIVSLPLDRDRDYDIGLSCYGGIEALTISGDMWVTISQSDNTKSYVGKVSRIAKRQCKKANRETRRTCRRNARKAKTKCRSQRRPGISSCTGQLRAQSNADALDFNHLLLADRGDPGFPELIGSVTASAPPAVKRNDQDDWLHSFFLGAAGPDFHDLKSEPWKQFPSAGLYPLEFYSHSSLGGGGIEISGGGRATLQSGRPIEERNESGHIKRQSVFGPFGDMLWQLRSDGSSQYILEDALGSTAALAEGTAGIILERITYDAYGRPVFEDPSNNPVFDLYGNFIPRSQYGNSNLFAGYLYDPEMGKRTADPKSDVPGTFSIPSKTRPKSSSRGGLIFGYKDAGEYYWPGLSYDVHIYLYRCDEGRFSTRDDAMHSFGSSHGNPYSFAGNAPVNINSPSSDAAILGGFSPEKAGPITVMFNPGEVLVKKSVPWKSFYSYADSFWKRFIKRLRAARIRTKIRDGLPRSFPEYTPSGLVTGITRND